MQLIPMTDAEFADYLAVTTPEYAAEHVQAGNWTAEEAEEKAYAQMKELLPEGPRTPDNYMYTMHVEGEAEPVGLIWVAITRKPHKTSAFIYDIIVHEPFRRRGYASEALNAIADKARELGAESLGLHVFAHNTGAHALYQKLGFVETDIIMKMPL
ncbi:MAG TPA: GNAT family N-acetyltransferase [Aggregatilinea sp.]|jgi:RimJ/RimL family protein N-acetyltransferase|uniref:GNAT family N-acetyltransferase n=1 Tax=Aggregatilinea sp. TaxID=2806333 RepID=UPI002CB976A5|nr:GNAT family N-acetyltransferase [Aggregatilinea sp.]HML24648.1 GNAT family N-acetyltransferase [Aggregatilinea sp.]